MPDQTCPSVKVWLRFILVNIAVSGGRLGGGLSILFHLAGFCFLVTACQTVSSIRVALLAEVFSRGARVHCRDCHCGQSTTEGL